MPSLSSPLLNVSTNDLIFRLLSQRMEWYRARDAGVDSMMDKVSAQTIELAEVLAGYPHGAEKIGSQQRICMQDWCNELDSSANSSLDRKCAVALRAALEWLASPPKYAEFRVTADAVVFCNNKYGVPHVLLIQRGKEPFIGSWCFPGGHVDRDEDLRTAAARELREETGFTVDERDFKQVGAWGKPGRDPRGQYVTIAFATVLRAAADMCSFDTPAVLNYLPAVKGDDDATAARWVPIQDIADGTVKLGFDHGEILLAAQSVQKFGWRRGSRERGSSQICGLVAKLCRLNFTLFNSSPR